MYADRYHLRFRSRDGHRYRVALARRAYTGPVETLTGADVPVRFEHGRQGERDPFDSLIGQKLRLSVLDRYGMGLLSETAQADPTAFLMRLERLVVGLVGGDEPDPEILWAGFVVPGSYETAPGTLHPELTVTASEGFSTLAALAYDPAEEVESVLDTLVAALAPLGLDEVTAGPSSALQTLSAWRPWRSSASGDPVPGDADPLVYVGHRRELWTREADVRTSLLEVLKQLAGRFHLDVFQAGGQWHARQRSALVGAGSAPFDVEIESVALRQQHLNALPGARLARSAYDVEPDLDSLVLNPSFEEGTEPAPPLLPKPYYWQTNPTGAPSGGAARRERYLSFDPSQENQWLLELIPPSNEGLPVEAVRQEQYALVPKLPSGAGFRFDLVANAFWRSLQGSFLESEQLERQPRLTVEVGDYRLMVTTIEAERDVLKGTGAEVKLTAPLFSGVLPIPFVPASGTLAFAAGTEIAFSNGDDDTANSVVLELTREARTGDMVLVGRLSGRLSDGMTAQLAYWQHQSTAAAGFPLPGFVPEAGAIPLVHWTHQTSAYSVEGAPVHGEVRVSCTTGRAPDPTTYEPEYWLDDVRLGLLFSGENARTIARQAAQVLRRHGDELEPRAAYLVGDGATAESYGRLMSRTDDGDGYTDWTATLGGGSVGWKRGSFAAAEASTGLSIDALACREIVYAHGLGSRRFMATLLLRPSDPEIDPASVLRVRHRAVLSARAADSASEIQTRAPLRLGDVLHLPGDPISYTRQVERVEGLGPYLVTLNDPVAQAMERGAAFRFEVPYAIDYMRWDVASGSCYVQATEIRRDDHLHLLEQVITEA